MATGSAKGAQYAGASNPRNVRERQSRAICGSVKAAQYAGAPKARNMKARGKREAQRNASPLGTSNNFKRALKVRNINRNYSALSELQRRCARYQGRRASRCSALAPGFHIARLWR